MTTLTALRILSINSCDFENLVGIDKFCA